MTARQRTHGTRACYAAGCRRPECTQANREAWATRNRMVLYGTWQPYVDAGRAREHLRALGAAGVGWKRAAVLAGVSNGSVSRILYGGPGARPPCRRIRPETEQAILAVRPDPAALAAGALVDVTGTRRRMQALVAIGWSQARLAARLGLTPANFGSMLGRSQVTAATVRCARALYDELWDTPPRETDRRTRQSASRARNYAAARGWPVPMAWDDGTIDDPQATPAGDWQRCRETIDTEGASELEARGWTRQAIAERLGVSRSSLDTALIRARRRAS